MIRFNCKTFSRCSVFCFFAFVSIYLCWSPLFHSKVWIGHDFNFHIYRAFATIRDMSSGQKPPLWDVDNYGHEINVFYPPAFNYLLSFVFLFTSNVLFAEKICVFFIILAVTVSSYFLFYKHSGCVVTSILFSLMSSSSTYMIDNIFIRAAYPESMGMIAIPIMFLGLFCKDESSSLKFLFIANVIFILTNIPMALCSGVFFIIYYLFYRKLFKVYVASLLMAIFLCSWYVIPMLYSFVFEKINMSHNWFPTMVSLSVGLYDLISGAVIRPGFPLEGMSLGVGFPLFSVFVYSVFKVDDFDKNLLFLICVVFVVICSGLDYSKLPSFFSPLSTIQFSWRFIPFLSLSMLFFVFNSRVFNFRVLLFVFLSTSFICSSINSRANLVDNMDVSKITIRNKDYFPPGLSDIPGVMCYSGENLKPSAFTKKINDDGLPSYIVDVSDFSNCVIPFIAYKSLTLSGAESFKRDGYFHVRIPSGHNVLKISINPDFEKIMILSLLMSVVSLFLFYFLFFMRKI